MRFERARNWIERKKEIIIIYCGAAIFGATVGGLQAMLGFIGLAMIIHGGVAIVNRELS